MVWLACVGATPPPPRPVVKQNPAAAPLLLAMVYSPWLPGFHPRLVRVGQHAGGWGPSLMTMTMPRLCTGVWGGHHGGMWCVGMPPSLGLWVLVGVAPLVPPSLSELYALVYLC